MIIEISPQGIHNWYFHENKNWSMKIDLDVICRYAGKREYDKYYGVSYVDYPLPRAKKLLRVIYEYATDEVRDEITEFFNEETDNYAKNYKSFQKLAETWKKLNNN